MVTAICAVVVVAAIAAEIVLLLGRYAPPFREVSDGAILEIYTLEAAKGRLLTGPYSRFGWHHPGPLFFYVEAPWHWLSGRHTVGMQAGAVLINWAAVAAIAWWIARLAQPRAAAAVAAAIGWYVWRTGDMIASAWNPHVIVLPMLALLVAAAALARTARPASLYGVVLFGSFLVQTHLATTPIVGVAAAIAVAAAWRVRGAATILPHSEKRYGPFLLAAGLAIVLWLPAIVEQVIHTPGNMTRIAAFFLRNASDSQTFGLAVRAWSDALLSAFAPGFQVALGFDVAPPASMWPVLVAVTLLIALGGAAVVAYRRGDRFAGWLASLCAVASFVALAATTRIRGQIVDHETFWISAIGALDIGVIAGVFASGPIGSPPRVNDWPRLATSAIVTLLLVAISTAGVAMTHAMNRRRTLEDHAVDVLAEKIRRAMNDARASRPFFTIDPGLWTIAAGSLLQLRKDGLAFAVDDRWTVMFGDAFAPDGHEDLQLTLTGSMRLPVVSETP